MSDEPSPDDPLDLGDIDAEASERVQSAPANLAFAGICGCFLVGLVIVLGVVLAVLSLPTLKEGNRRSTEREAIRALRAIEKAQRTFRDQDSEGDGKRDFGTLAELGRAGLIGPDLASGVLRGYRLEALPARSNPTGAWMAIANRVSEHGGRSFALNHRGSIHYAWGDSIPMDSQDAIFPNGLDQLSRQNERYY